MRTTLTLDTDMAHFLKEQSRLQELEAEDFAAESGP